MAAASRVWVADVTAIDGEAPQTSPSQGSSNANANANASQVAGFLGGFAVPVRAFPAASVTRSSLCVCLNATAPCDVLPCLALLFLVPSGVTRHQHAAVVFQEIK